MVSHGASYDVPTFSYGFSWFLIAFPMASCWFSFRLLRPSHGLGVPAPFGPGPAEVLELPFFCAAKDGVLLGELGPQRVTRVPTVRRLSRFLF